MTPFQQDLRRRQIASFGALKVVTRDQRAALREMREALKHTVLTWSCASGIWRVEEDHEQVSYDDRLRDPGDLIHKLFDMLAKWEERVSLVLHDFDPYLKQDPVARRVLVEAANEARVRGHLLILLSRDEHVPPDMEDDVSVLRHPLPGRDVAERQLIELVESRGLSVDREKALEVVQGLTTTRQADAIALGVADAKLNESSVVDVGVLRRFKESEIAKLNFLSVSQPSRGFADIVGHGELKAWLRRRYAAFAPAARAKAVPIPRGMLLVGPPGTGKTRFPEALAAEWGIPFLTLSLPSVFSSLLGESEQNIATALEIAERMAPCVLLIDEVESVISDGAGDRDGGTTERVIGQLLTWTALKTEPVFLVLTSNVAEGLPPALIRRGRLDGAFFVDFPSALERRQIFDYYLAKAPVDVSESGVARLVNKTKDWSGAEIEAVVADARTAAFADGDRLVVEDDLMAEVERTVPVSASMADKVAAMRAWAKQHALSTVAEEKRAPGKGGRAVTV